MWTKITDSLSGWGFVFGIIGILGAVIAPFIYHIVYCFQTAKYVLLIAGTIIPPIGWFHGVGAFFGWW